MRITPQGRFIQANGSKQFCNASGYVVVTSFMNDQRLGNHVFHAKSWVKRGKGILKNDLEVAPKVANLTATGSEQIPALEVNRA